MRKLLLLFFCSSIVICGLAQKGSVSLGTRAVASLFGHDNAFGRGLGGQVRYQFSEKLNSEWFADMIVSPGEFSSQEDYHFGWSLMFYWNNDEEKFLRPYFLAGHCFDISKKISNADKEIYLSRFTAAVQMGLGTHLNILPRFDVSLNSQYMLHLGKEIEEQYSGGKVNFSKSPSPKISGHLLLSLSANYKIFR